MDAIKINFFQNYKTNQRKFFSTIFAHFCLPFPCRWCITFIESIEHLFIGYFVHMSFTHAIHVSTYYVTRKKPRRGYPHVTVHSFYAIKLA